MTPAAHAIRGGLPAGQAHPGPPLVPSMVGFPRIKRQSLAATRDFDAHITCIDHSRTIANQYAIGPGTIFMPQMSEKLSVAIEVTCSFIQIRSLGLAEMVNPIDVDRLPPVACLILEGSKYLKCSVCH